MTVVPAVLMMAPAALATRLDKVPERVGDVSRYVAVQDVHVGDAAITGTIDNRSSDQKITKVALLISDRFLWTDEFSPGPEDPSRGRIATLDVVVPPGGSVPFRIDRRPLPHRTDGRFVTDVSPIRVETMECSPTPTRSHPLG